MKKSRNPVPMHHGLNASGLITDTSRSAQCQRVLAALRIASCTTVELRDGCNVMMPAARIKELKDAGHTIITDLIDAADSYGRQHGRIARYTLIQEARR
ncbi:helix-turn-helix domain-containing protein [Chitinilyticum litopenaei]|uniref:helix-turn-helix domain-containing protein n=1 Tax=Chitinilyticum litopenaei TaxID=1121276 RepID=UPI00041713A4|nr:helix-turn-helix domain-containing protein [Chitinilyticum litopenaei]